MSYYVCKDGKRNNKENAIPGEAEKKDDQIVGWGGELNCNHPQFSNLLYCKIRNSQLFIHNLNTRTLALLMSTLSVGVGSIFNDNLPLK